MNWRRITSKSFQEVPQPSGPQPSGWGVLPQNLRQCVASIAGIVGKRRFKTVPFSPGDARFRNRTSRYVSIQAKVWTDIATESRRQESQGISVLCLTEAYGRPTRSPWPSLCLRMSGDDGRVLLQPFASSRVSLLPRTRLRPRGWWHLEAPPANLPARA